MKRQTRNLFSVEGRRVVITGATGRVGSALCRAFAEAGATVFAFVRSEGCAEAGVTTLKCDLASAAAIHEAMGQAGAAAPINVLINAAHVPYGPRDISDFTADLLIGEQIVGLAAPILLTKAAVAQMGAAGGSIINVGSVYGRLAPPYQLFEREAYGASLSYACTKGALAQLTRYLAAALADKNIRVNTLSPAPLPDAKTLEENEWYAAGVRRQTPLGRPGAPEDIVGAALFLASDASAFVTGHDLVVDGGWSVW